MNAKDAWLATLGQLQIQLNRSTYDTWLRHAELLGYEDGRFVVTVPHAYAKDWIERHLLASMTRTLSDIFRRECEIQIAVWNAVEDEEENAPLLNYPEIAESLDEAPSLSTGDRLAALNPAFSFDSFVVGESNQYAALLARAIAEGQAGQYSPALFCGSMGMGKTHLLQAITRGLLLRGSNAVYVTAEDFTTELVTAIRTKENLAFREKYRSADAVLMDDLQFVEGKIGTQNEIVAIWDALRNRQKTIVFAATRLPADMPKLSKDARSRFQAGPIAMLEAPGAQLRREILDAYCQRRRIVLPPDVRDLIASHADVGPRDLEGAVEQLVTYARLTGQRLTAAMAQAALHQHGSPEPGGCSVEAVLTATAQHFQLTVDDLSSRQRHKMVALARQIAMYLARELTGASLLQIGAAVGGRDHSTVLHGCARITQALDSDPQILEAVGAIRQQLGRPATPTRIYRTGIIETGDLDAESEPAKKIPVLSKRLQWPQ